MKAVMAKPRCRRSVSSLMTQCSWILMTNDFHILNVVARGRALRVLVFFANIQSSEVKKVNHSISLAHHPKVMTVKRLRRY